MKHLFRWWPWVCLTACSGPEAPDALVCRDVVVRLCQTAVCPGVSAQLVPGEACESTLLQRTGCEDDAFTFADPTRERVLRCREALLTQGPTTANPPTCSDARRFVSECPDVAGFFWERQQP